MIGSLRASQYLSLILCAVAAFVLLWRACKADRPSSFGRYFLLCLLTTTAAMTRWFVLGNTLLYMLLMATILCSVIWLMAATKARPSKTVAFLMLLIALDVLCLRMAVLHPSEPMIQLLHSLVCSIGIPVLVWWLIGMLHTEEQEQTTKEEREPCPSES